MSDWDETRKRRSGTSVRAKPRKYSRLFACRKCRRSIAVVDERPIEITARQCKHCGGVMVEV